MERTDHDLIRGVINHPGELIYMLIAVVYDNGKKDIAKTPQALKRSQKRDVIKV